MNFIKSIFVSAPTQTDQEYIISLIDDMNKNENVLFGISQLKNYSIQYPNDIEKAIPIIIKMIDMHHQEGEILSNCYTIITDLISENVPKSSAISSSNLILEIENSIKIFLNVASSPSIKRKEATFNIFSRLIHLQPDSFRNALLKDQDSNVKFFEYLSSSISSIVNIILTGIPLLVNQQPDFQQSVAFNTIDTLSHMLSTKNDLVILAIESLLYENVSNQSLFISSNYLSFLSEYVQSENESALRILSMFCQNPSIFQSFQKQLPSTNLIFFIIEKSIKGIHISENLVLISNIIPGSPELCSHVSAKIDNFVEMYLNATNEEISSKCLKLLINFASESPKTALQFTQSILKFVQNQTFTNTLSLNEKLLELITITILITKESKQYLYDVFSSCTSVLKSDVSQITINTLKFFICFCYDNPEAISSLNTSELTKACMSSKSQDTNHNLLYFFFAEVLSLSGKIDIDLHGSNNSILQFQINYEALLAALDFELQSQDHEEKDSIKQLWNSFEAEAIKQIKMKLKQQEEVLLGKENQSYLICLNKNNIKQSFKQARKEIQIKKDKISDLMNTYLQTFQKCCNESTEMVKVFQNQYDKLSVQKQQRETQLNAKIQELTQKITAFKSQDEISNNNDLDFMKKTLSETQIHNDDLEKHLKEEQLKNNKLQNKIYEIQNKLEEIKKNDNESQDLKEKIQILEDESMNLKNDNSQLIKSVNELQKQLNCKEEVIKHYEIQKQNLSDEMSKQIQQIRDLENLQKKYNNQKSSNMNSNDVTNLEKENAILKQHIKEIEDRNIENEKLKNDLETNVNNLKHQLKTLQDENNNLQEKISIENEHKNEINTLQEQITSLQKENIFLKDQIQQIQNNKKETYTDNSNQEKLNKKLKEELTRVLSENKKLQNSELSKENKKLQTKINQLENAHAKLASKVIQLKLSDEQRTNNDIMSIKNENEELKKSQKALENEILILNDENIKLAKIARLYQKLKQKQLEQNPQSTSDNIKEQEIAKLKKENIKLKEEITALQSQEEKIENTGNDNSDQKMLREQITLLQELNNQIKSQIDSQQSIFNKDKMKHIQDLTDTITKLDEENTELAQDLELLRVQLNRKDIQINELQLKLDQSTSLDNDLLTNKVQQLEQQSMKNKSKLKDNQRTIQQQSEENEFLKSRLRETQNELKKIRDSHDKEKSFMNSEISKLTRVNKSLVQSLSKKTNSLNQTYQNQFQWNDENHSSEMSEEDHLTEKINIAQDEMQRQREQIQQQQMTINELKNGPKTDDAQSHGEVLRFYIKEDDE